MKNAFFITGTDTGVGKTYSTVALLNYFNQQQKKTAALKPVASGAKLTATGLRNDDALQLQAAMSIDLPYHHINPFVFEPAIAPHLAAPANSLTVSKIMASCQSVLNSDYDMLLIEGAGGWLTPLNNHQTLADLAEAFRLPIILVVGLKLGCLNHALLTWHNIKERNLVFAGWIANYIDPNMPNREENITTLIKMLDTPPLAILAHQGKFNRQQQLNF